MSATRKKKQHAAVVVEIEANLAWKVFQSQTSTRWIAVCDELNLCLEGETEEELHSLIPEAIGLLMSDLLGDDELERYLQDKGWRAHNIPTKPDGDVRFNVPWHIVADGARSGSERRYH